jgi:hypothetical protein
MLLLYISDMMALTNVRSVVSQEPAPYKGAGLLI